MMRAACGIGGAVLTTLALAGCSSGKSESIASASRGGASGSTHAVLADRAFAVATDPVAVGDTSLTFATSAEVASFRVGDTLAPASTATAMSTPYLRTVASIAVDTPAPGETTFATTQAALDDLFSEADLDQTLPVTAGDPNAAAPIDAGAANILAFPLDLQLPRSTSSPLDFTALPSGSKLWSLGSNGTGGTIGLSGGGNLDMSESSFAISGGVGFTYQKQAGLTLLPEHVRLVFSGGMNIVVGAKLTTTGALSYTFPSKSYGAEVPLGTVIVSAGPVPIPVLVSLSFSGSGTVSLSTTAVLHEAVTGAFQVQAGVDYTASGGATGVFTHQALVSYSPFTLSSNVAGTLRLYPLSASLNFRILGVAGPSVSLSPYIGAQVVSSAEAGTNLQGIYGLASFLSGDLTVFSDKLAGLSLTLFSVTGTFPSCLAGDLVCSGGPIVGVMK